jgi:hypothetical protein
MKKRVPIAAAESKATNPGDSLASPSSSEMIGHNGGPALEDDDKPALSGHSVRAAYTVKEFIRDVIPMARAVFYSEVKAGRLRTVTLGRRRYVPAEEGRRFIAQLASRRR